jgi:hypothetical protein
MKDSLQALVVGPIRMLRAIVATSCTALLLVASAQAQSQLALIVGISDYPGPNLVALPSSVNDAQAIHDFLSSAGYPPSAIQLKKNITRREMVDSFSATLRAARDARIARGKPLDQFVFFYSGHGTTVADGSNGDVRDEGPDDSSDEAFVFLPEAGRPPRTIDDLLVRDDLFFEFLQNMSRETRQLIVILDACHSGGLFRGGDLEAVPASDFPTKSVSERDLLQYLTAVGGNTAGLRADQELQARDIVRDRKSLPRELEMIECELLFAAAATDLQAAASGDPRSQFTDRLMSAVMYRPTQVLEELNARSLSIESLDEYLTAQLASVRQTPVIFARGIPTSTAFLGELFVPERQSVTPIDSDQPYRHAATWRLLSVQENQRPETINPNQVLETDQAFLLQIEPTEERFVYVVVVPEDARPELILPDSGENRFEEDYRLPADFSVSIPRDGPFRFTGEPGTETLHLILTRQPIARDRIAQLTPDRVHHIADSRQWNPDEPQPLVPNDATLVQVHQLDASQQVFLTPGNAGETIVLEVVLKHR